jgi:hypothetical protein
MNDWMLWISHRSWDCMGLESEVNEMVALNFCELELT